MALLVVLAVWFMAFPPVCRGCVTVLYSFSPTNFTLAGASTNLDGAVPESKLVLATDGYLYGTTARGGIYGAGSIFRISPTGGLTNLYSFPPATNAGDVNYNLFPNDLVQGTDGNLYGTTQSGGTNSDGTIFELSLGGSFNRLHTFGADGVTPVGSLVQGADGNFYGVTQSGGTNGTGTIFQITPGGAFASLYSFPRSMAGTVTTNGVFPNGLALGGDGFFYGTTQQGGVANAGTFFRFSPTAGLTQIASFKGNAPNLGPVNPISTLVPGANGVFYGTSLYGGSQGGGAVFAITNNGGVALLHSFNLLNAGIPSTITLAPDGTLYGTTAADGLGGEGTLFRLTPQGQFGDYAFSSLNTNFDNMEGANPLGGLTTDSSGNLFGTGAAGGTNGTGAIFRFAGADFIPPYFLSSTNLASITNALVESTINFFIPVGGSSSLALQWRRNGTNLTNGNEISGANSSTLTISPVFGRDAGTYTLVASDDCGSITSVGATVTVKLPGVAITSPKPNASLSAPMFSGTATNAPLAPGANPNDVQLVSVVYSFSNLFGGSNITGTVPITPGAKGGTWSITAVPSPGTNILTVQSVDASGDMSPLVSRTFFYESTTPLTIVTTGSGTGNFSIPNGALLNVGETYAITARPIRSIFSNWIDGVGGPISYNPTLHFLMQSNLVLTANFMARQLPAIHFDSPKNNERTANPVLAGTATPSPVFGSINPTNVQLTNILYTVSNSAGIVMGSATMTPGAGGVSNWMITNLALLIGGTNTVSLQAQDMSGDMSKIVSRTFFYKVPALFLLTNAGNGTGTITSAATIPGDTPPANGAMLNLGEAYRVTAHPGDLSLFTGWSVSTATGQTHTPSLSFIMQSNLEITATFIEIPPITTITSPTPNQRTANPVFSGMAYGHFPISNVWCSLGQTNGVATLIPATGDRVDWSIDLPPVPGSNVLTAYCEDVNSNVSKVVSRNFFYRVAAELTVTNIGTGGGTVRGASLVAGDAPPANGAMLYIGEGYKITAIPDHSSLFSNWVINGSAGSTSRTLSFTMQSNLVLSPTFTTNFFPPVAGTYNGLFSVSNAISPASAGFLSHLVLRSTGAFSGRFLTQGTSYSFSTNFDASGHANFSTGPLHVGLTLDTVTPQITGLITNGSSVAQLTAVLAATAAAADEYTLLFAPATNVSTNLPFGDGYSLVRNHNSIVTLGGALADGTAYSQTVPVSVTGQVPVYVSLYPAEPPSERGLLFGWLNLTNLQAGYPTNGLTWVKQTQTYRYPARYTNGFNESLAVTGAPWITPAAGGPAISLTGGQLVVSNGFLNLNYQDVTIAENKLANAASIPTNSLTGTINPQTGFLKITFGDGKGRQTEIGYGAFLQNMTNAGGYFLTTSNAGLVNFEP